eukprot:scaffold63_cov366-Prasinococcus_capsulatus_cf.AAC.2
MMSSIIIISVPQQAAAAGGGPGPPQKPPERGPFGASAGALRGLRAGLPGGGEVRRGSAGRAGAGGEGEGASLRLIETFEIYPLEMAPDESARVFEKFSALQISPPRFLARARRGLCGSQSNLGVRLRATRGGAAAGSESILARARA